jgi:hypothetical protein
MASIMPESRVELLYFLFKYRMRSKNQQCTVLSKSISVAWVRPIPFSPACLQHAGGRLLFFTSQLQNINRPFLLLIDSVRERLLDCRYIYTTSLSVGLALSAVLRHKPAFFFCPSSVEWTGLCGAPRAPPSFEAP